jgi:hypothetical protein
MRRSGAEARAAAAPSHSAGDQAPGCAAALTRVWRSHHRGWHLHQPGALGCRASGCAGRELRLCHVVCQHGGHLRGLRSARRSSAHRRSSAGRRGGRLLPGWLGNWFGRYAKDTEVSACEGWTEVGGVARRLSAGLRAR